MTAEQIKAKIFDLNKEHNELVAKINAIPEVQRFTEVGKEVDALFLQLDELENKGTPKTVEEKTDENA